MFEILDDINEEQDGAFAQFLHSAKAIWKLYTLLRSALAVLLLIVMTQQEAEALVNIGAAAALAVILWRGFGGRRQ